MRGNVREGCPGEYVLLTWEEKIDDARVTYSRASALQQPWVVLLLSHHPSYRFAADGVMEQWLRHQTSNREISDSNVWRIQKFYRWRRMTGVWGKSSTWFRGRAPWWGIRRSEAHGKLKILFHNWQSISPAISYMNVLICTQVRNHQVSRLAILTDAGGECIALVSARYARNLHIS